VVVEGGPDGRGVERPAPADQGGERDRDAGQAVAALARVVGHERGLDRGAGGIGGQARGGGDGPRSHVGQRQRARRDRAAVDQHSAGAALVDPAAVFRTAVAGIAPQGPQQRRVRIGLHLVADAVHLQRHGHRHPR
jgi:hypothetical protein